MKLNSIQLFSKKIEFRLCLIEVIKSNLQVCFCLLGVSSIPLDISYSQIHNGNCIKVEVEVVGMWFSNEKMMMMMMMMLISSQ
jgi:hypothetical protein